MPSFLPSFAAIQRRQRVHAAVRELMAEQGFRISMEAVASRAGCSKQTLYAQFGSKQALLRSVIDENLDLAMVRLDEPGEDLRGTLIAFAMEHLAHLCDPSVVATSQLLTAEAHQFPEEAQALYRDGCDALVQRLAHWLAAAMQRGQLRNDDPHLAAELLLSMIVGLDFERQRFAVPHRQSVMARRRWAGFSIDAFLRAFSADDTGAADTQ
jgi:AcrR family transcriptional regulator